MSFLKKLLNPIYKSEGKIKNPAERDQSNYFPEEKLPIDEKFTYNFKKNGGKFLYCENNDELMEAFDNILLENDWYEQNVFCVNEQLESKFSGFNLNFTKKTDSEFFISSCESLIATNGSILLSSNQIKEKKLHELPLNIIILSTTSKIKLKVIFNPIKP